MAYIVKGYTPGAINLAPKSTVEEILQNLTMIISTPQFTVPQDRGFGLAQKFVDKPIQVAQTIIVAEVLDAIERLEPRAEVLSVTYEGDGVTGKLIPIVEVDINGG